MSVYRLALAKDGPPRLEVRQVPLERGRWEVLLDDRLLAKLEHEQLTAGHTLTLEDGSELRLHVERGGFFDPGHRLRVERDGALLRDSPVHPLQRVRVAAGVLWAVGLLGAACGVIAGAAGLGGDDTQGRLVVGLALLQSLAYVGLGAAAGREKRWALIVATALASLDLLGAIVAVSPLAIALRAFVLVMVVRGLRAQRELARVDAASVADVFR